MLKLDGTFGIPILSLYRETEAQRSQVPKRINGRKAQCGMELRGAVDGQNFGRWKTPGQSSCSTSFLSVQFLDYMTTDHLYHVMRASLPLFIYFLCIFLTLSPK